MNVLGVRYFSTCDGETYEHMWTHPSRFDEQEVLKWGVILDNWNIKLNMLDADDPGRELCQRMIEYCSVRIAEIRLTDKVVRRMEK